MTKRFEIFVFEIHLSVTLDKKLFIVIDFLSSFIFFFIFTYCTYVFIFYPRVRRKACEGIQRMLHSKYLPEISALLNSPCQISLVSCKLREKTEMAYGHDQNTIQ